MACIADCSQNCLEHDNLSNKYDVFRLAPQSVNAVVITCCMPQQVHLHGGLELRKGFSTFESRSVRKKGKQGTHSVRG